MFVNEVEMYNASVEEGETPLVLEEDDPLLKMIPFSGSQITWWEKKENSWTLMKTHHQQSLTRDGMQMGKKKTMLPGQVSPFGITPSEPLAEESIVVEGQVERRKMLVTKKQKKKKVSFSLGGLVLGRHVNTTDHFDHVDSFLSALPEEAAMTSSRDPPVEAPQYIGNQMLMYEVITYDSENDDDLCYYAGALH